ncbi:hypothetical protein Tco_0884101 [Tanacetum coccineum]
MTRSYETLFLATLEVVQTMLAFPRVLDDMETSRLASLQELNLYGTQLVVAVVIDKSFGTYQQNLSPDSAGPALLRVSNKQSTTLSPLVPQEAPHTLKSSRENGSPARLLMGREKHS